MARYVAAIDQGTTSTRLILFDARRRGSSRSTQREHEQIHPRAGWVEHDPREIWQRTREVIGGGARARAGERARTWRRSGITNQRETTVVWDRASGEPVHNAIVWQDTRTEPSSCASWPATRGRDRLRERVGPAAVDLLLRAEDRVAARARRGRARARRGGRAGLRHDRHLAAVEPHRRAEGGVHATDVTNASRTMLMDLRDARLARAEPRADGHPARAAAARSAPPSEHLRRGRARARSPGVPLAGILGDQQAALFGQTCFARGEAKNTYGTGSFLLRQHGRADRALADGC